MFRRLASSFSTPIPTPPESPSLPDPTPVSTGITESHSARASVERDLAQALAVHGIPTSAEDCSGCAEDCSDDGEHTAHGPEYESYPRGFEVDWESDLLGSANPAPRNIVISTARSDWAHDHTTDTTTLSYHLQTVLNAQKGFPPPGTPLPAPSAGGEAKDGKGDKKKDFPKPVEPEDKRPGQIELKFNEKGLPQGISSTPLSSLFPNTITSTDSSFSETSTIPAQPPTSLFSSSLVSQSASGENESALIFPEWTIYPEVPNSLTGAGELFSTASASAGIPSPGDGKRELEAWTIPYRAVVLLCSHKKRDKRCHIAAPLLEKALIQELESFHVHTDLKGDSLNPHHLSDIHPSLSNIADPLEREEEREKRVCAIEGLEDESGNGEVGIFRISHLGGHRYAGVMIILFPSGATLYYGRVSPKDIPQVVKETILKGKIMAGLMRGGNNVVRDDIKGDSDRLDPEEQKGCGKRGKSLLNW